MIFKRIKTGTIVAACASIILAAPITVYATENESGAWFIFQTTDQFQSDGQPSRWRYTFDAQARYFDPGSGINQWLARPGIGYEINDNITGWVGYARFRSRNRAGQVTYENRYWQQIDWTAGHWIDGRVSMRVRLEQRDVSSGDDTGLVIRLMAKYVRPIGEDGNTSLIVGIEPFIDLRDTDWGGDSGLGQHRLFIGLGRRLNDRFSVEAGYMNQYIWSDSGENRSNHLAMLNFKVRM